MAGLDYTVSLLSSVQLTAFLTVCNALIRLLMAVRFGYTAWHTRTMSDPLGRTVTPVLFTALTIIFLQDGVRGLMFYWGITVGGGYWNTPNAGDMNINLASVLIANLFALWAVTRVERAMLSK